METAAEVSPPHREAAAPMRFPAIRVAHPNGRSALAGSKAAAAAEAAAHAPAADAAGSGRFETRSKMIRVNCWSLALGLVALSIAIFASGHAVAAQSLQHRTFSSAEDAARTLVETVKKGDVDALLAIFGQEGKDLLATADPAAARKNRKVFAVAAAEQWRLADEGADRKTLVIGNEEWPFPVPIVKDASGWRFDTAAGKEEVIARRIGRNELAVIDTLHAYVAAQRRYAEQGHDGNPPGAFAQKFRSDQGKQNGLYWPTQHGQKRSPLGDLLAEAAQERRPAAGDSQPSPFNGYYYRILTAQGPSAPGGAKSYVVKGQMTGGFALIAWPAQYDTTGVMTFVVNQDGVIRERDLGAGTEAVARKTTSYNPDASWRTVQ